MLSKINHNSLFRSVCRLPLLRIQPHRTNKMASASAPAAEEVKFETFLTHVDVTSYAAQLAAKQKLVEDQFAEFNPPPVEVFQSRPDHYRMRAEFNIWHEGDDSYYVMHKKDETGKPQKFRVDTFPVASELLNELMTRVIAAVRTSPVLRNKLFQSNFHTTLAGHSMVTLIYHRKLDDAWSEAAKALRTQLAETPGATSTPHIIGRSKKQRVLLDVGEVVEELEIPGRGKLQYVQVEGAFSQPNASICTSMLGWAVDATKGSQDHDLLELYCGNGNFTAAVAPNFRNVVATELSKSAVAAARRNFESNGVGNVFVARMSSEDFVEAWHSGRQYERLKGVDLKACKFETLLVDPPRAGLDEGTTQLLREFQRVVYISCNPETLKRDVRAVSDEFEVERFAIFDQFPYTSHVECGMLLKKRASAQEDPAAGEEKQATVEQGEGEGDGSRGVKRKAEGDAQAEGA